MSRQIIELIQFGAMSIGTAKKVIREIRAKVAGLKSIRPEGFPYQAAFLPKGTPAGTVRRYEEMSGFSKGATESNAVVVPRLSRRHMAAQREIEASGRDIFAGAPRGLRASLQRRRSLSDPVAVSLHEHGHALMPKSEKAILREASRLMNRGDLGGVTKIRTPVDVLREETRANRSIADLVRKHGSPTEVKEWVSSAQGQLKPYRNNAFYYKIGQAATAQQLASGVPFSLKRQVLKENPSIRTQRLSSISALIHFERVENPIFRKGVKSGVHRIGEGKEKMIRIRSIVSPQWGIDKGKVSKMARKKNLPPPVVSHLGHGVYVLKDGNHRVNAILRQGKRKILAKVQKL